MVGDSLEGGFVSAEFGPVSFAVQLVNGEFGMRLLEKAL